MYSVHASILVVSFMLQDVCTHMAILWKVSYRFCAASVSHCAHLQPQVLEITKQRDDALENVAKLHKESQVLKVKIRLRFYSLFMYGFVLITCPWHVFSPTVAVVVEDREINISKFGIHSRLWSYLWARYLKSLISNVLTHEHEEKGKCCVPLVSESW